MDKSDHSLMEDTCTRPSSQAIDYLQQSLEQGETWFVALLEAMSLWTASEETYRGRRYCYLIGGEAFDWHTLAKRLLDEVDGLIPSRAKRLLLKRSELPYYVSEYYFKRRLGAAKYRGYLNYYYGVVVERAIIQSAEDEVRKALLGKGYRDCKDVSEDAFLKVYHTSRGKLLHDFSQEKGYPEKREMNELESKEFTYWLFKYRLHRSDKAKLASDTKKGLERLHRTGTVQLVNGNARARYGHDKVVG